MTQDINNDEFWRKLKMENKKNYLKKIIVHDYDHDYLKESIEIEAYCLADFYAFFYFDDKFYIANGDDDHWWVVSRMDPRWVEEFKEVVSEIEVKKIRKRKRKNK